MKGKYLLLVITMMIRPYLHNAKYYETDQMGIIHHSIFAGLKKQESII